MSNLIHNESVIKVDCIVRKNTPYRHAEFDRRKQIKIENFSTWITSKEDLIISKLSGQKIPVRKCKCATCKILSRPAATQLTSTIGRESSVCLTYGNNVASN
jgi:hypothetical protein